MQPTIYEAVGIAAGTLSIMAKPVAGEWIEDKCAGLRKLGVEHVVSLLEIVEQADVGLKDEESLCVKNGIRYTSFPIIDRDVPEKVTALDLAATLHQDIKSGKHVVIHCRAGIGRTGIIASAVLVTDGYLPAAAIHTVSFARGVLIPDTDEQEDG